jgi:transposase-like protein
MDHGRLARMLESGASYEEIAREAGVSRATFRAWMRDAGLEASVQSAGRKPQLARA